MLHRLRAPGPPGRCQRELDDLVVGGAADGIPEDAFEAGLESFVEHGFEMLEADVLVAEAEAVGQVVVELVAVGDDAETPFSGAVVAGIVLDPLENLFEGEGTVGKFVQKEGGDFLVAARCPKREAVNHLSSPNSPRA